MSTETTTITNRDERILRKDSVVTNNADLEPLFTIKNFPAIISCTDKNKQTDIHEDLCFYICKKSGMVQINPLLPPQLIYGDYHSEALGKTWEKHHHEFLKILRGLNLENVYEIGGSNGYMAQEYIKSKPDSKWTLVDIAPSFEETEQIKVLAADITEVELPKGADIVHSHLFEHIFYPDAFMARIHANLEVGKYNVFSVPNLKKYLENQQSNVLNFEHTLYLTEDYIEYFLKKYSFELVEKVYFEKHSIMYVTKKVSDDVQDILLIDQYDQNKQIFTKYFEHFKTVVEKYNTEIEKHDEYYLFGAHVFSQFLLAFGLNKDKLKGIIDNSDMKENKRLYGTDFSVFKPDVLVDMKSPLAIVNAGQYQKEVEAQLRTLNPSITILK